VLDLLPKLADLEVLGPEDQFPDIYDTLLTPGGVDL